MTPEDEMMLAGETARSGLEGALWDAYIEDGAPYGTDDAGFARWRRELHDTTRENASARRLELAVRDLARVCARIDIARGDGKPTAGVLGMQIVAAATRACVILRAMPR